MKSSVEEKNYTILKNFALSQGAALFGVCRLTESLKEKVKEISDKTLKELPLAISIGVRLSEKIIEDIEDHPTFLYLHHYRQANYLLDRIAFLLSNFIQQQGYKALAIPASQVIDWEKQKAHLSHKHVAEQAGLGWIGKNNLLVTPRWGARVRLVSILTDFPLKEDKKIKATCGNCRNCLSVCPAGAIKEKKEEFDHLACFEQLKKFRKYGISHYICGICVKACKGKTYSPLQNENKNCPG